MLEARGVSVAFGRVQAVSDVDLVIPDTGGTGLVGESGSGKTTISRVVLRLLEPDSGSVLLDGQDVGRSNRAATKTFRRAVQAVFQDTDTTLNPRMRVGKAVAEVLRAHDVVARADVPTRVASLLAEVGLEEDFATRLPHQLSGGQRQRVALARALALEPRHMVFDEPTSALDVTVQERILALIEDIRERRGFGYLLVSHNLAVVQRLCESLCVLYLGQVVEKGPSRRVLDRPAHPYTVALRSAVPRLDGSGPTSRVVLSGPPADPANRPAGCSFHPRCPMAAPICQTDAPALREIEPGRWAACHRAEEVLGIGPALMQTNEQGRVS
jgi:oligopeptide/dipeptide ABC transporter ATP-binding protein